MVNQLLPEGSTPKRPRRNDWGGEKKKRKEKGGKKTFFFFDGKKEGGRKKKSFRSIELKARGARGGETATGGKGGCFRLLREGFGNLWESPQRSFWVTWERNWH